MTHEPTFIINRKLEAFFGPDSVRIGHHVDRLRIKEPLQPEKRLMLAVLDDAVACILKYARGRNGREKRLFCQTEDWLMATEEEWPFSFVNICEALGLHPGSLRSALIRKSNMLRKSKVQDLRDASEKNAAFSCGMAPTAGASARNRHRRRRAFMNRRFAQHSSSGERPWKKERRMKCRRCLSESERLFRVYTDVINTIVCASCAHEALRLGLPVKTWMGKHVLRGRPHGGKVIFRKPGFDGKQLNRG
jgi:hypothetical protein